MPRYLRLHVLLLVLSCLHAKGLRASAACDVAQLSGERNVNECGRVLLDPQGLDLPAITERFKTDGVPVRELLSGGYRDGYYWADLQLTNSSATPVTFLLSSANRLIYHFEVFTVPADFQLRRIRDTVPTLEMQLQPGQDLRLFLRLKFGLQDHVNFFINPPKPIEEGSGIARLHIQDLVFGVVFSMVVFNFALFGLTRDKSFALHGLAAVMIFSCVFFLSGLSYYYFGVDSWNFYLPVCGNFAVAANNAFGQVYLNMREGNMRTHRWFTIGMIFGILGGVALMLGASKKIIYLTDINLLAIVMVGMSLAYFFPLRRYRNMRFYVIGWLGLAFGCMIWLASEYAILQRSLITEHALNVGLAFELVVMSLGLADQINHYKNSLSETNRNLEQIVDEKTRDIRSMMEYIPMGVFMIQSNERIHRDHSRHMHTIFPLADLEHRRASDIIFEPFQLAADDRSQAVSCLQMSLGETSLNFETNQHVLPLELRDAQHRVWDLTWNAIENSQGTVDRILVTMREVTELRRLLERSQEQQAELEVIGEIIAVEPQAFRRFLQSTRELLAESLAVVPGVVGPQKEDVVQALFINAHTIKGAARTLRLKRITERIHQMEQAYAEQRWDVGRLRRDLESAVQLLEQYERIAVEKLGRTQDQSRTILFSVDQAEQGYGVLQQALRERLLPADVTLGLEKMRDFLHQQAFRTAGKVFTEICSGLPGLARDLKKAEPEVELRVDGFAVRDQGEDILRKIFVHLLRNSMDHGIESADERLLKDKPAAGRITISLRRRGTDALVIYEDDGRGLDIGKIRRLAEEKQLIPNADAADAETIAALIFDAQLSTAHQVTDISGRGVGMSAVKRFAHTHFGDVAVKLEQALPDGFYRFALHITLPLSFFEVETATGLQKLA